MKLNEQSRKWRTDICAKREQARQMHEFRGKNKRAAKRLLEFEMDWRDHTLLQLQNVLEGNESPEVCELAIEKIELMQNLSAQDRKDIEQFKARLSEKKRIAQLRLSGQT